MVKHPPHFSLISYTSSKTQHGFVICSTFCLTHTRFFPHLFIFLSHINKFFRVNEIIDRTNENAPHKLREREKSTHKKKTKTTNKTKKQSPNFLSLHSPSSSLSSFLIHGRVTRTLTSKANPEENKLDWFSSISRLNRLFKTLFDWRPQCGLLEKLIRRKTKTFPIWGRPRFKTDLNSAFLSGSDQLVDLNLMVCVLGKWLSLLSFWGCSSFARVAVAVRLHMRKRRCSFTSRLAWEASRYRAQTMGLLT